MQGRRIMMQDIPNLSAKHLRAIVSLARFGSFIAASSYLRISQPGLSRIIQQTEEMLGVLLFTRGTRNVSQTPAGREFIPAAERMLGELLQQTQRVRDLDDQLRGQLIISGLISVCRHVLPSALVTYRKQHPKIHIHVREGVGSFVQEDVRSGFADFGIGNVAGLHDGIAVEAVSQESCFVVVPRRHPLSASQFVRLKDLADEQMISMPPDSGLRRTIDVAAAQSGVILNYTMVLYQYTSLFELIANGLGVSIVPASALPVMKGSSLVARPLRPAITRQIGILHLSERPLSPASRAFLEIFRPKFIEAVGNARRAKKLSPL
jgi:LysR family carnitine catabolism transcriptional activator